MKKVRVLIIYGEGINSEKELVYVFQRAGAEVDLVHITDMINRDVLLSDYHIFGIPGGFSYGDHLGSGKLLSATMIKYFQEDINNFLKEKKLIIGICNGFQILVKMGLLPFSTLGGQSVSLSFNRNLRYEDRWVKLEINSNNNSAWLKGMDYVHVPVRHGEGRLVFRDEDIKDQVLKNNLNVLSYVDENNSVTEEYPYNPNGSPLGIAGLCDMSGRILGLMPHFEVYRIKENAPAWKNRDLKIKKKDNFLLEGDGEGMAIFYNGVRYIEDNLL